MAQHFDQSPELTSAPPSPLTSAMSRPAPNAPKDKKKRKVDFQALGPLEFSPTPMLTALAEVEEGPKRKRVRTRAIPRSKTTVVPPSEGPRGTWTDTTDRKDRDYELKVAGKLEGFLPCSIDEWMGLPNGSHTKYTRQVWQGEGRKVVYAVVGEFLDKKVGRVCNGYKSAGPAWNCSPYEDTQFYKSDGHKRTKSTYVPRPASS